MCPSYSRTVVGHAHPAVRDHAIMGVGCSGGLRSAVDQELANLHVTGFRRQMQCSIFSEEKSRVDTVITRARIHTRVRIMRGGAYGHIRARIYQICQSSSSY